MSFFSRPLPPDYRDELRTLLADPPTATPQQLGSILLFQLGDLRLALPTSIAFAVAPVLHIARIPHRSGTVLLGLAAFRGDILPCCSLARILDIPASQTPTPTNPRTLLLQESPGRLWAAPIDAVLGVRTTSTEALTSALDTTTLPLAAQSLRAVLHDDHGPFYLLDPDVLFRQITLATA